MFILWIKFIIAAAVVVICGYRICLYAEKIARIIKISRAFAGLILLAVITSLPELAVAISATKIGALDLAVGDLFGSNLFNLTIVGIIFLKFVKKPRVLSFEKTHFISLAFSALLIALAAVGIAFSFGVETALILVVYIFGAYLIFRNEKTAGGEFSENKICCRQKRFKNLDKIPHLLCCFGRFCDLSFSSGQSDCPHTCGRSCLRRYFCGQPVCCRYHLFA